MTLLENMSSVYFGENCVTFSEFTLFRDKYEPVKQQK
jgi:hypothetical protein